MAKKTYHGSCRCKQITYEADLDLAGDGTGKCNCTYCGKMRWWGARATPETFRLLSGGAALGYGFTRERFFERGLCTSC
ncbi:MAG TPA: aldehyde-activating protein, partial [Polyangiaceae bacterium]|nr:aldehyde-activating protein [Polyangiaceae bacterium]